MYKHISGGKDKDTNIMLKGANYRVFPKVVEPGTYMMDAKYCFILLY